VVVVGLALTAFAWVVASPTGGSPDDDFHLASIWCPTPIAEHCQVVEDGHPPTVMVPGGVAASDCYRGGDESAACSVDVVEGPERPWNRLDEGLYPGPYYDVQHVFAGSDIDLDVVVMRCFNAALAALVFGALYALSSRGARRLQVYTLIGTSVPLVIYFITSVNPSSWALTGVAAAWLGLGVTATNTGRRAVATGAIALAGAALAACARSDAGAYLVLVAAVTGFLRWRDLGRDWRKWAWPAAVAAAGLVSFAVGGQSSAMGGLGGTVERDPHLVLYNNVFEFPRFLGGFWGLTPVLGWLDTPSPPLASIPAMAVSLGLVAIGLAKTDWRKNLMLAGLACAIVALPLWVFQQGLNIVGENVQVRYIAPLVIVFVGVALTRRDGRGADALSPTQAITCYALTVIAHSAALHGLIRRYVTGTDVVSFNLNLNVEWWRSGIPSPLATWALGSLGFALVGVLWFVGRANSPAETTG
jgi:hypothetical protein